MLAILDEMLQGCPGAASCEPTSAQPGAGFSLAVIQSYLPSFQVADTGISAKAAADMCGIGLNGADGSGAGRCTKSLLQRKLRCTGDAALEIHLQLPHAPTRQYLDSHNKLQTEALRANVPIFAVICKILQVGDTALTLALALLADFLLTYMPPSPRSTTVVFERVL